MNKKSFYLLAFFCIAFFCLFLYLVFKGLFVNPTTTPTNTPSITPTNTPSASFEIEEEPEKGLEISMLIDKTPYYGTFFSLAYDFNTALFTVNIDPANKIGGEKEFNDFLKQNGIPDESYVADFKTTYFPPPVNATPAP